MQEQQVYVVRPNDHLGLLVAGYVMAFLLPIGGIVVGFALAERRTGHAVVICMLSTAIGCLMAAFVLRGLA